MKKLRELAKQFEVAICMPYPELEEEEDERESTSFDSSSSHSSLSPTSTSSPPSSSSSSPISASVSCPSRIFNSAVLIDSDGSILLNYRKTHLWGDVEGAIFTPGDSHQFDSLASLKCCPNFPMGILICYDLEFPEPARILSLRGARIILAPTALTTGDSSDVIPLKMLPSRAAENHIFIIYANHIHRATEESALTFCGLSGIFGPDGSELARGVGVNHVKETTTQKIKAVLEEGKEMIGMGRGTPTGREKLREDENGNGKEKERKGVCGTEMEKQKGEKRVNEGEEAEENEVDDETGVEINFNSGSTPVSTGGEMRRFRENQSKAVGVGPDLRGRELLVAELRPCDFVEKIKTIPYLIDRRPDLYQIIADLGHATVGK